MHEYVVLDVFTDVPLQGNQVAVFTDGSQLSGEVMQRAARELNLSETVFLLSPDDGADARLRIFTPRPNCRSRAIRCSGPHSSSASDWAV